MARALVAYLFLRQIGCGAGDNSGAVPSKIPHHSAPRHTVQFQKGSYSIVGGPMVGHTEARPLGAKATLIVWYFSTHGLSP